MNRRQRPRAAEEDQGEQAGAPGPAPGRGPAARGQVRRAQAASGGPGPSAGPAAIDAESAFAWGDEPAQPTLSDVATEAVDGKSAGQAVDAAVASRVGGYLGVDLGAVRVHADPHAEAASAALGARAFAHGPDVFLGRGESPTDLGLMAHELTHVAQQGAAGRASPARKVDVGPADSPAEREADEVASAVVRGAAPTARLVDGGHVTLGQMTRGSFLAQLREAVTEAADAELGPEFSAVGCPYIDIYFQRYANRSSADIEAVLRRFAPGVREVTSAAAMIPIIVERVRAGVRTWRDTGAAPPEVAAMEPAAAGGPTPAQALRAPDGRETLSSLEAELGAGQPLDPGNAQRMSLALGADVGDARIHTGPVAAAKAAEAGAVAFAAGPHVVLGAGAPGVGTVEGDALLAHELAHTAQQAQAARDPAARRAPLEGEHAGHEEHADEAAAGAMASLHGGRSGSIAQRFSKWVASGLRLQRCANAGPSRSATVEQFMRRRMAVKNHMPSTGLGAFDVEYKPGEGALNITVRMSFDPRDSKDGTAVWGPGEAAGWQAQYQQLVQTRWSSAETGHLMRCTRPGWDVLVARPVVHVEWVDPDADPHFKLVVTKGQLEADVRPPKGTAPTGDGRANTKQIAGRASLGDTHVETMTSAGVPAEKAAATTQRQIASAVPSPLQFREDQADLLPEQVAPVAALGDTLAMVHEPPIEVELRARPAKTEADGLAQARTASVAAALRSSRDPGHGVTRTIGGEGGRTVEIHLTATPSQQRFSGGMHETGHMLGLDEEYSEDSNPYRAAHYALVEEAMGGNVAKAFVSRKAGDFSGGVMGSGLEVRPYHYVTFWEALGRITEPDLSRAAWRIE